MIEAVKLGCICVLSLFFCFSTFAFAIYLCENEKQKGMIIFTFIMLLLSIVALIVFTFIVNNIPPVVGTVIAR